MADDMNKVPPPARAEALARWLTLALDAEDWAAYDETVSHLMSCPSCESQVIGTLVTTLTLVLNQYEPTWRAESVARIAALHDTLHGPVVTAADFAEIENYANE